MHGKGYSVSLSIERLREWISPNDTLFVETGSRWGDTTINALKAGASFVCTAESDELFRPLCEVHVKEAMGWDDCTLRQRIFFANDSVGMLTFAKDFIDMGKRLVVFLDAHTDSYSPLLKELIEIAKWPKAPDVLIVDDWNLIRKGIWSLNTEVVYAAINRVYHEKSKWVVTSEEGKELVVKSIAGMNA